MAQCLLLLLLFLLPRSLQTECYHARSALPILLHCEELAEAIDYLSRRPGENDIMAWGRRLPTTRHTQKLPKVYWISGRGPSTCAIHIDVNPTDYFAVDSFNQSRVASCASRVVQQCLAQQGLLGLDYPTAEEHVYVKVVRSDSPMLLDTLGAHEVENVALPDSMNVLHVASKDVMIRAVDRLSSNISASLSNQ